MLTDPGDSGLPDGLSAKISAAACARLLEGITDAAASLAPVKALKDDLTRGGLHFGEDEFERALLRHAATVTEPLIADLPVHQSVRLRMREEFGFYTQPTGKDRFEIGGYLFASGCKVISLRRFPAGPMEWEISGIPRSWLLRIPKPDLPRTALFIARRLGGFHPFFFMHVARRQKNRSLIIEREVLRAYYRMARSLEPQPSVKGIMASAWFHDPAAFAANPHLVFLNKPYLEAGGLITTIGPADEDAGFLEHNAERKEQLKAGKLNYRIGLALWPRREAIAWAAANPSLES